MALVVAGKHTGKSVRCQSRHFDGGAIFIPCVYMGMLTVNEKSAFWLVVGDVGLVTASGKKVKGGEGYGILPEYALLRVDSEGDDELNEEFGTEEAGFIMEEMMIREGVKRLW